MRYISSLFQTRNADKNPIVIQQNILTHSRAYVTIYAVRASATDGKAYAGGTDREETEAYICVDRLGSSTVMG